MNEELQTRVVDSDPIRILAVQTEDGPMGELRGYLESRGLAVSCCVDPELALEQISRTPPDLVLIQSARGSYDGMRFCAGLRERSDVPIIVIADRGEDADCVLALEVGADDFVADASSPRELLARIRARVRRARGCLGPALRVVQVGALRLDPRAMIATLDGRVLSLTSYEFQLLQALAERAGQVLSREQLMEMVGGRRDESFDRAIDVRISRLRGKLGDDPRAPRLLKTVRGAGYLYAACDPDPSS